MAYNASQTKSPVCNDLRKTQWQATYDCYCFNFSTMKHRDKFLDEVVNKVAWLNDSMSRRFHVSCDFESLAVIQLYMQIEGRGFLVFNTETGEVFESPNDIRFYVELQSD